MYKNFDTGETFTLEELKELFNQFNYETEQPFDSFDEWLENQLDQGRNGTGGLVEI